LLRGGDDDRSGKVSSQAAALAGCRKPVGKPLDC
jgi:hypothetical protein